MQIAVYGKGGIGKSTISSNISAALGKSGKKVLQVGCDPKSDSTKLLLQGAKITTALDYIKQKSPDKFCPSDIIHTGAYGVSCIEAGGPEPGVGCAGRGILTTFDLLQRLGVRAKDYDGVIYDVLGDVVCGGFAVPLRRDYADKVIIITSGEYMSVYAANNILRGLKNYSAEGNRAAGIIFNSRGQKDEEERVRSFCDAVGLPVLAEFSRDALFSDSEKQGMCLLQCFPESETALIFEQLATAIINDSLLYPAKPLSDEELERHVLGKTTKRVTGSMPAKPDVTTVVSTQTKKPALYSKSLISREPLHGCAFSGAMSICTQVTDAITIAHGPNSCSHITYQAVTAVSRRFLLERGLVLTAKTAPAVISTAMNESVMIFGGTDELRKKIQEVKSAQPGRYACAHPQSNGRPKLIFVLTTCPSGIIGDDISFVKELEDEDTKIIPIIADGNIAGDYPQGILMAYTETAMALIDKTCVPEPNLVNIIGEKSEARTTSANYEYIAEILADFGVRINSRFICETTWDELRNFKKASLNLMAYNDYLGRTLKGFFENEYDAKFLDAPFPVGFNESRQWVEKIGSHYNMANKAKEIIQSYSQTYENEISMVKPYLKGKRLMVLTYNHRIDWLLQTAVDLEMEISFVGIMNFSGDNIFNSVYKDSFLEFHFPYSSENRYSDLNRVDPDILLTNYSDAELEGEYFTDTVPLCPPVGFLSGIIVMKRWSEFFKMNLSEGWRRDADNYRKYFP